MRLDGEMIVSEPSESRLANLLPLTPAGEAIDMARNIWLLIAYYEAQEEIAQSRQEWVREQRLRQIKGYLTGLRYIHGMLTGVVELQMVEKRRFDDGL